jgi:hypothetical protein
MGTRATTTVKDSNGKTIMVLYRQSDGYQDCHGKELKEFLETKIMINGISYGDKRDLANGMGCLAAQMVAKFKTKVGLFYIYPESTENNYIDFAYTVYPTDDSDTPTLKIKVESHGKTIFDGVVAEYKPEDACED